MTSSLGCHLSQRQMNLVIQYQKLQGLECIAEGLRSPRAVIVRCLGRARLSANDRVPKAAGNEGHWSCSPVSFLWEILTVLSRVVMARAKVAGPGASRWVGGIYFAFRDHVYIYGTLVATSTISTNQLYTRLSIYSSLHSNSHRKLSRHGCHHLAQACREEVISMSFQPSGDHTYLYKYIEPHQGPE